MKRTLPLIWLAACAGDASSRPTPPVVMAPAPAPGGEERRPDAPNRSVPVLPRGRSLAVQDDQICVVHRGALFCRADPSVTPAPPPAPPLFTLPNRVSLPGQVIDVASSRRHRCAVTDAGKVFCWGSNARGALGRGDAKPRDEPAEVPGIDAVVRVAVAETHSCALTASAEVYCWGDNWQGEVGHDTAYEDAAIDLIRPIKVPGVANIESIWASEHLTCARTKEGTLRCWGQATGLQVHGPGPTTVEDLSSAAVLAFGRQSFWCWVPSASRPVACRGQQYSAWTGLLPHRDTDYAGTEGAVELALGNEHACARSARGRVLCWGSPAGGVLGRVVDPPQVAPAAPVPGIDDAREIATSDYRTCALGNRALYCWGRSPYRADQDRGRDARVERWPLPR